MHVIFSQKKNTLEKKACVCTFINTLEKKGVYVLLLTLIALFSLLTKNPRSKYLDYIIQLNCGLYSKPITEKCYLHYLFDMSTLHVRKHDFLVYIIILELKIIYFELDLRKCLTETKRCYVTKYINEFIIINCL